MSSASARVGLVGQGYLGSFVYQQLAARPELGLEVVFVHDADAKRLAGLPPGLALHDLADWAGRRPDLVVELAHPDVTRRHGMAFLQQADYMPFSLTAFAEAGLDESLRRCAVEHGRRLFVPHGAVVGLDALDEGRPLWERVTITMKKPLRSLDFSAAPHLGPSGIQRQTVLYDGPVRGICPLFPRNVNTHAAVAMAGIGFDRTRSVLIADPALEASIIELEAAGSGVAVQVRRENPMKGVSGVLTQTAALASITRARTAPPGVVVC